MWRFKLVPIVQTRNTTSIINEYTKTKGVIHESSVRRLNAIVVCNTKNDLYRATLTGRCIFTRILYIFIA